MSAKSDDGGAAFMDTKTCSTCKTEKPVEEFHRSRACSDGLQTQCKPCQLNTQKRSRNKRSATLRYIVDGLSASLTSAIEAEGHDECRRHLLIVTQMWAGIQATLGLKAGGGE